MKLIKLGILLPFKDIQNRRSLVALDNLVALLILCPFRSKAPGNIFLVSDDNDSSTADLIGLIPKAMNRQPKLLSAPTRLINACSKALGASAVTDRILSHYKLI